MNAKRKNVAMPEAALTLLAVLSLTASGAFLYSTQDKGFRDRALALGEEVHVWLAGQKQARPVGPVAAVAIEGQGERMVPEAPAVAPPPGNVIPRAVPMPDLTVTLSEAVSGGEGDVGIARYVLGGDGMTREVRRAWETLERARAGGMSPGPANSDDAIFRRAAGEIGYVPAGLAPSAVRSLDDAVLPGPDTVTGPAEFLTGDTLLVDQALIRLQGAAAPKPGAHCETSDGVPYDCSAWSVQGMETIVDGREVICVVTEHTAGEEGAHAGWCDLTLRSGNRRDLGEIGVRAGLLQVDATDGDISPYLRIEAEARSAGNGLWSGRFRDVNNGNEDQE